LLGWHGRPTRTGLRGKGGCGVRLQRGRAGLENSWRATAPLAGLLVWRCCWVELEVRIGVDGLGIKVWVLKRIQTIEFKFEFEFQQPKIMLQHECNN
jgi:hypothetical protein